MRGASNVMLASVSRSPERTITVSAIRNGNHGGQAPLGKGKARQTPKLGPEVRGALGRGWYEQPSLIFDLSGPEATMTQPQERRDPQKQRKSVSTLVEVCGNIPGIPVFEAESVDVSPHGMHLRTAYLPEEGAPL